jgi:hypothetical protein
MLTLGCLNVDTVTFRQLGIEQEITFQPAGPCNLYVFHCSSHGIGIMELTSFLIDCSRGYKWAMEKRLARYQNRVEVE